MDNDERCSASDIGGNLGGPCSCSRCTREQSTREQNARAAAALRDATTAGAQKLLTMQHDDSEQAKELRFKLALRAMPLDAAQYVMEMLAGVQREHRVTIELCDRATLALKAADAELNRLRDERPALVAELQALRTVHDPSYVGRQVAAAVTNASSRLEHELRAARAQIAEQQQTIAQLTAAKRKLRDALERTKEPR